MRPFFKRIEINFELVRSLRFRISRTNLPKPALSWHPLRGFSLNTRHGVRVSKTFKGITVGFQNTRFKFNGRWYSNIFGINFNASKSGFSVSQRNFIGTYNFANPNRSSANLLGIQIRGKKAAPWALLGLIISLPIHIYGALVVLARLLLVISMLIAKLFIIFLNLLLNVSRLTLSFSWYILVALFCTMVPDEIFDPRASDEDEQ